MVAESDIQRIAKLTPLADVLASFDLSVGPVAPREEVLSAALGLTLAGAFVAAGVRSGAGPSPGLAAAIAVGAGAAILGWLLSSRLAPAARAARGVTAEAAARLR